MRVCVHAEVGIWLWFRAGMHTQDAVAHQMYGWAPGGRGERETQEWPSYPEEGVQYIKQGEEVEGVLNSNIIKDIHWNIKIYSSSFLQLEKLSVGCVSKVPRGIGLDRDILGTAHLASHTLDAYFMRYSDGPPDWNGKSEIVKVLNETTPPLAWNPSRLSFPTTLIVVAPDSLATTRDMWCDGEGCQCATLSNNSSLEGHSHGCALDHLVIYKRHPSTWMARNFCRWPKNLFSESLERFKKKVWEQTILPLQVGRGVGCFSNERGFLVESSLQGISSNSSLQKRNSSVVM